MKSKPYFGTHSGVTSALWPVTLRAACNMRFYVCEMTLRLSHFHHIVSRAKNSTDKDIAILHVVFTLNHEPERTIADKCLCVS